MKQALRQSIIAARQKLPAAERAEYSQRISASLVRLEVYQQAETVLGYMSFGAEFDTRSWLEQALLDGKQVLLPKVNSSSKQLELFHVRNLQQDVAPGVWSIPEPVADRCEKFETLSQLDFILLPGVAFARDGARLGYGGGFYDKLLARINPLAEGGSGQGPALAAAAFSMQLVRDIPMEATDRRVQWLLTEQEVIDCTADAG